MIWQAIVDKYRSQGATGFAKDAVELAFSCYVIGVYEIALGAAAIGAGVVALPFVAAEWVGEMAEYRES